MARQAGEAKTKSPRAPAAARASRNYDSPVAQKIIEVALPQFADRGFDNVTMRELAREAGLELPSIYYQFKDKRELYLKCLEAVIAKGNEGPLAALKGPGTADERLYRFMVETAAVTLNSPPMSKFMMRELLEGDREGLSFVHDVVMNEVFDRLLATLEEATGQPASMLDPIAAYSLSLCMYHFSGLGGRAEADLRATIATPEALAGYVMRAIYPQIAARLGAA